MQDFTKFDASFKKSVRMFDISGTPEEFMG